MRKAVVLISVCLMLIVGAAPQTEGPVAPPKQETVHPLIGYLLKPSPEWMERYQDKPLKDVATYYTFHMLIRKVNDLQQQNEDLRKDVANLKLRAEGFKKLVHGIQKGGDSTDGPGS